MCCDNPFPRVHAYEPSGNFHCIYKLVELQCCHTPKGFEKKKKKKRWGRGDPEGKVVGVMGYAPGGAPAWDMPGAVVTAAGGWGGPRARVCEELVWVSSSAGQTAGLWHCLAGGERMGL